MPIFELREWLGEEIKDYSDDELEEAMSLSIAVAKLLISGYIEQKNS